MLLVEYIKDFTGLIYPKVCLCCKKALKSNEDVVCTFCLYELPQTNFHLEKDNKVSQIFWGRVEIETATSLFYYQKGGKIQKLIHEFKYYGKQEAGLFSGQLLAGKIKQTEHWQNIDIVLPVPLHPKKLRQRGYNQSEYFAKGISQSLGVKLSLNNLIRQFHSESQTRKSKYLRWKNVETVYHVRNPEVFRNKNLLLTDDVITTGSTLEACTHKLLEIEGTKIWLATLAIAS